MPATSISRRVEKSVIAFKERDYEDAFVQLFPAIDKTAKKRRPKDGVAKRIKKFISDEEAIITAVATNNILKNINIDGIDFPTALYKFGRISIVHEGELDKRLQINERGIVQIGQVWNLPASYIIGLIVAVVIAPENANEKVMGDIEITLFDKQYKINELWGQRRVIQTKLCKIFRDDGLFDK